MASIDFPTRSAPVTFQLTEPFWILIAIGIYLFILILIISIRQCLVSRGICAECNYCGKADQPNNCCDCFLSCAQFCNCNVPDARSCCDSLCGPRRRCDFGDCLSCDCCKGEGNCCEVDETNSSGKTHSVWKVGIRKFPLMDNPHCECGSQSYFTLWPKDFCQPPLSVSALRFVLYQPSPSWKTFSLEEIHVYPMVSEDFVNPSIPRWLIQSLDDLSLSSSTNEPKPSDQAQIEGLPDPDDLSLKMQQLWMLAEKIQDSAPGIDLGRFDVDGCYEINLLSYT